MRAWVGLGSNLDDPPARVRAALRGLEHLPETRLVAASSLYGSTPVGPADQPDFINAAALLETRLQPQALLDCLQGMERRAGRVRRRRWGERVLDLDILLWGQRTLDNRRLRIPHPQLHERPFVLIPLLEISPDLRLPGGQAIAALARRHGTRGVWYHGPAHPCRGRLLD